jgi:hypothetical protein
MRTSIFLLLSSLMVVGCGGSEDGGTVTEEDTGSATTETSATDDTGTAVTDTGTATDDTGTTTEETGADTMMAGDTLMAGDTMMGGDTMMAGATFTQVYAIISAKCSPCHTTSTSGGLDMKNKMTAYGELVGKKAEGTCAAGGMTRVVAGSADTSLLIHKLTKTSAEVCGDRMPEAPRPVLPASEITTIRSWINAGAKND